MRELFIKMNSTFRFCIRKVIYNSMTMSNSSAREARMLKKMIDRGLKREKLGFQEPRLLKKRYPFSAYENEGETRKMIALNKVYMERVPEMVCDWNFGSYFSDLKIQITKVQITKNLKYLNIYYTRDKVTPEDIINEALRRAARELQMRLGNIGFSGKIPFVRFINDIRMEHEINLENIFKNIDLGRDSVPTHSKKVITSCIVSKPDDLPVMRQDVLGIDVAKIKQRISADIFRFKAINTVKSDEPSEEPEYPTKLIHFTKKDFFKFYKRKRIEELKRKKKEQGLYMYENIDEDEYEYESEDEIDYEVLYGNEDENEDEDVEYEDENEDEDVEYEDENEDENENKSLK